MTKFTDYRVASPRGVTVLVGEIRLTDKQAARRPHALAPAKGKGIYEIAAPVFFKAGEEIGLPAPLNKSLTHVLDLVEANKSAKPAAGKDTDPAKAAGKDADLAETPSDEAAGGDGDDLPPAT